MIEALQRCGVNRVSLGVQSFVDHEAASVGRLHKRSTVLDDIARLRAAGIENINIDLIAGLPHQTAESWEFSVAEAIATGAPHVSVYMLEVDDDSRLGRELMAGGTKYHAHFVPDDELTADFYETACERLKRRECASTRFQTLPAPGQESRHNLKYWTRQPYLGFGVDAHSMLTSRRRSRVRRCGFLRRTRSRNTLPERPCNKTAGLDAGRARGDFLSRIALEPRRGPEKGRGGIWRRSAIACDFRGDDFGMRGIGAARTRRRCIRLTPRGRLLSNEVFERFILCARRTDVLSAAFEVGLVLRLDDTIRSVEIRVSAKSQSVKARRTRSVRTHTNPPPGGNFVRSKCAVF